MRFGKGAALPIRVCCKGEQRTNVVREEKRNGRMGTVESEFWKEQVPRRTETLERAELDVGNEVGGLLEGSSYRLPPAPRGPGALLGAGAGGVAGRSSHSARRSLPTSGSSSVPSRETFTSRSAFQGFRRCRVRLKDKGCTRIHTTGKGVPHSARAPLGDVGSRSTSPATSVEETGLLVLDCST